jgi:hypothetical protein
LNGDFTHNVGDFRSRFDFFTLFSRFNSGESPGEGGAAGSRRGSPDPARGWDLGMDLPPLVVGFMQALAAGIGARVNLSIGGKIACDR